MQQAKNPNTGRPRCAAYAVFKTLEKQPCKQRSDLVLNGQMRVYQNKLLLENRVSKGLPVLQMKI